MPNNVNPSIQPEQTPPDPGAAEVSGFPETPPPGADLSGSGLLGAGVPLFVDLDGTLISTDVLAESVVRLVRTHPPSLLSMPGWLLQGLPVFKRRLAERAMPDVAALPYRPAVLAYLREQREAGRPVYLATGADRRVAEAVSEHLGLFDGVIATDTGFNCKGLAKLGAIRERVGDGPFAYMGDGPPDLPVWADAGEAILIGVSPALRRRVTCAGGSIREMETGAGQAMALLRAMRPKQWVKNLLLFTPMLAGHLVTPKNLLWVALGFVCFCLAASGIYLINDVLDMHVDRRHPTKCRRPLASGALRVPLALTAAPVLLLASLVLAVATLPALFVAMLGVYLVATLGYTLEFRRRILIDVVVLAGLYTLRVFAGASAIAIVPSFWMLAASGFLFLSLGFLKRYTELRILGPQDSESMNDRGYGAQDLRAVHTMGVVSGYAAAVVLCLYINSDKVVELYATPALLWPVLPLFLYWVSRLWLIAGRGGMVDDPVAWTITDRASWIVLLLAVLLGMLAAR